MNHLESKNTAKRMMFYLAMFVLFVVIVLWKVAMVQSAQGDKKSLRDEYVAKGDPITVTRVKKDSFHDSLRMVATQVSQELYQTYVDYEVQQKLYADQKCSLSQMEGDCFVDRVAQAPNIDNDLYHVSFHVALSEKSHPQERIHIIIPVDFDEGQVVIPREAVRYQDGVPYVWIVDNAHVHRRDIVLARENSTEISIQQGLDVDETIVLNGAVRLQEDTFVRIVKE